MAKKSKPIKINVMADTAANRKRVVAASGGYTSVDSNTNDSNAAKYASSGAASVPITRNAQSGANVTSTQPMFFSPMHTPQNWQTPQKRREMMQWLYTENSSITRSDYTNILLKDITFICDKVIKDPITGGLLYENIESESVLGGSGELRNPLHFSIRDSDKKRCFSFKAKGNWRKLEVSEEHKVIVLDGKLYRKKKKLNSNRKYRDSIGGTKAPFSPYIKISDNLITRKEAQNVVREDYLLAPLPIVGKENIDKDLAWTIGCCIADGCMCSSGGSYGVSFTYNKNEREEHVSHLVDIMESSFDGKVSSSQHGEGNGYRTKCSGKKTFQFYEKYITGKHRKKKFTHDVFDLDKESRLSILGGYFDGDGCFSKKQDVLVATNYSCDMADQIYWLLLSCGIVSSIVKQKLGDNHYKTDATHFYKISLPSSEVKKISPYMKSNKIPFDFIPKKQRQLRFIYEEEGQSYIAQPISEIKEFLYTGKGYDIQIDPERCFVSDGYIASNCRFYYQNEPKVAAGVDFYSNFSMNGYKLECKKKSVLKHYERIVEKLDLAEILNQVSHEYFLLGDVFPFLEIECPKCGGSNKLDNEQPCYHPDGSFKSVKILNPDYMDVKSNPLDPQNSEYFLIPDDELKMAIQRREPKSVYEKMPDHLINMISSGQPIPLSNRCVSHIKHNPSPYGTFGNPMLQRLFTTLAYKTKMMTANWIVAERLIIPVRVVKVGDKDRPASNADIADVTNQVSAVANDPNLTIVTHHAFEYEWYGAEGKIHNLTSEMEYIGKEILDGLMLNQAILNGDASSYSSAQVGVEILIRRLENWRNKLASWVEKKIFLPIAMMQGFVDEKETRDAGETVFLYPKLVWNDLQLRDKTNKIQTMMQLYDKGLMSGDTILEELGYDFDVEVEKMRDEQMTASAQGMLPGGEGGGNMGTMGMGSPLGGAPGGEMGGDMGGPEGGGMGAPGGDMGGGMGAPGAPMGGGMGGAPGAAAASALPKITKKGKGSDQEQEPEAPPQMIKFTKLEQKMYKILQGVEAPHDIFGLFKVDVPGEKQPYVIDFAYPDIGLGIEADGAMWHEQEDRQARDKVRDEKLANMGWRILRVDEDAIDSHLEAVRDQVIQNIKEAEVDTKKRNKGKQ
jgi:very-short-patch-repair endonuclease